MNETRDPFSLDPEKAEPEDEAPAAPRPEEAAPPLPGAEAPREAHAPPAAPSSTTSNGDPGLPARVAAFLAGRGLGPRTLAALALGLAAVGGVLFLVFHPRLGAIAGLLSLLASELSLQPSPQGIRDPLARALAPPVDLLVLGGLIGLAVGHAGYGVALLALLVLLLLAWLPQLEGEGAPGGGQGLWLRPDRLAVVLVGTLFGSFVWALVLVTAMGLLDAWVRLEHLQTPDRPGGPTFLRPLLEPSGRLVPAVRWGSLGFAVLLLILLRRGEGWPF